MSLRSLSFKVRIISSVGITRAMLSHAWLANGQSNASNAFSQSGGV